MYIFMPDKGASYLEIEGVNLSDAAGSVAPAIISATTGPPFSWAETPA